MNFFRDVTRRRRSSSASSVGELSPTMVSKAEACNRKQHNERKQSIPSTQSSYMGFSGKHVSLSSMGATATLRRVFLPRSRTTGFNSNNSTDNTINEDKDSRNFKPSTNVNKEYANCTSFNNSNEKLINYKSEQLQKSRNQCKSYRTESLGRNIAKKRRSSTVPNFQDNNINPNAPFDEKEEAMSRLAIRSNNTEKPSFSTFFQTQTNDSPVLQSITENTNANQTTTPRTSNDVEKERKMETSGNVNYKHMMIFGTQAGGINTRRGRSNLRPLSADVSLLTSEGRKIGKRNQSLENECDTSAKGRLIISNSMFRQMGSANAGHEDTNPIYAEINVNKRQSNTVLSTSNSEFFRVSQRGAKNDISHPNSVESRDHSLESLLDSEDRTYLAPSSISGKMTTSNTQNSISTLNSDYVFEDDDISGDMNKKPAKESLHSRPQSTFGSLHMKVQEIKAQLDVLKISGAETSSQCFQKALERVVTTSSYNEIQQKNDSCRAAPPTTLLPPPPIDPLRSKEQSLQHPNTPAQGYEHMLPPNLINNRSKDNSNPNYTVANTIALSSKENNSNELFFPLITPNDLLSLSNPSSTGSGSSDASMSTASKEHLQLLQVQQSLLLQQQHGNNTSSSQDTVDSLSPPTSPFHGKKKIDNQMSGRGNLNLPPGHSVITVPIRLPLSVAINTPYGYNGSLSSSSPSTLSPCSSNSTLPPTIPQSASSNQVNQGQHAMNNTHLHQSTNRPQGLKLPQSQSLNVFPSSSLMYQQQHQITPSENIDKLFFFFDVITTQEKIAKVR